MNFRFLKYFLAIVALLLALKFASKPFANSDSIIGRISNILNKNNTLEFECNGLNITDVQIIWKPEIAEEKVVYKNGKQIGKIGYEYGPNKFDVLLKNGFRFSVGHFKTNNWHSHRYRIKLKKNNSGYLLHFNANGPNKESYEMKFDLMGQSIG